MFIQRSQTPQINQCMGNTGNVYRNIGNVFKNHITVIEKKYIAIHIDIELLSSPMSSTTIRSYIHKCQLKLYCAKRKPYVNSVQKRRRLLWARRHLGWTITQWKRVLWSDESVFQVFFGRNGRRVLRTKEEKDHPDCYQQQVQKPGSVMVWGCVSALGKGNLHFCDGTINAEKYIEILEHNMLPSRRHLFQGRPCIFQQDNAKPHSAHITKSWLRRKRVRVLDWPACSPDLSPIENVWRILKRKMRQRRPRTVAHLKTCLQEEWDKITPETLHHLVSSVPKRLLKGWLTGFFQGLIVFMGCSLACVHACFF